MKIKLHFKYLTANYFNDTPSYKELYQEAHHTCLVFRYPTANKKDILEV